jgi:alpha-L-rhamnosidase
VPDLERHVLDDGGRGLAEATARVADREANGRVSDGSTYYSKDGNALAVKAKLLIRYADGTTQTVVTGTDGGWKATDTGPYRADDIYDGQTYDARQELPGWTSHGFDDTAWSDVERVAFEDTYPEARLLAYPGETARFVDRWDQRPRSITVTTGVTGQDGSPNGRGRVVVDPARTVTDPARAASAPVTIGGGETAVFDLGQNMVGMARYAVRGPAGAKAEFGFAEMLNDDSAGADGPEGSVYRANLRSAEATSTYILKGDPKGEAHQDSLTFYGFRYVSVTTSDTVTVTRLTGKVATSAVRETGTVTTNDADVNKLASNIRWGQRGNYLWVPTDCPQRDERLGWTGDTQVFATTGLYNADAGVFLSHFQDTVVDSQTIYGADKAQYTGVAPGGRYNFPGGGSGWADCGVVLPWAVWQMTGDAAIVERNWPSMVRYLDWIRRQTGDTYAGQGSLTGDWLAPQKASAQLMSDVYYGYSAQLMAKMARAIGRAAEAEEYERLFRHIKQAFITKYLSTDGDRVTVRSSLGEASPIEPGADPDQKTEDNSQAASLWVLKLGFYETEAQRRMLVGLLADNIGNDAAYKEAHPDSIRVRYAENTLSVGSSASTSSPQSSPTRDARTWLQAAAPGRAAILAVLGEERRHHRVGALELLLRGRRVRPGRHELLQPLRLRRDHGVDVRVHGRHRPRPGQRRLQALRSPAPPRSHGEDHPGLRHFRVAVR